MGQGGAVNGQALTGDGVSVLYPVGIRVCTLAVTCNVLELYQVLRLGDERRGRRSRVSCLTFVLMLMPKSNLVRSKLIAVALPSTAVAS